MVKVRRKNTKTKAKTKKVQKKKFSWSILWQNALTFLSGQVLCLATAFFILSRHNYTLVTTPVPWYYFITSLIIAGIFITLAIKYLKGGKFFILVFYFVIVLGTMTVFNSVLALELAIAIALIVLVLRITTPRIWTHNLAIILGLAGISSTVGLDLKPLGVIIILIVLSIYDYIAVYKTKTMVKMFKGLLKRGVIFSIVIPEHAHNWFVDLKKVKPKEGFMFLGTGDIALPMIFAASALSTSLISSLFIIIGALFGLITIHLLFAIQKKKAAMPALPPIALFSIIGYLISLFI